MNKVICFEIARLSKASVQSCECKRQEYLFSVFMCTQYHIKTEHTKVSVFLGKTFIGSEICA